MTKLLHPRLLGFFLFFLLAIQFNYAQQETIHCWDFNGTFPFTTPVGTDNRVTGDGSITYTFNPLNIDDFGGSTTNACSGSIAGEAFVVKDDEDNGSTVSFNFSSEGFEDLTFSFWTQRTGTGFNSNTIEYSTGGAFTELPSGSPYTPVTSPGSILSLDLSSISSINNQSDLVIRITFNGATSAGGNNRIDNVKLEGFPINDDDSVVLAPTTQEPSKTIVAADVTSTVLSETVLNFDIQDLGTSDALSTDVDQMRFVPGPDNTASWSTTLQDVIVRDDSGAEIPGSSTITDIEVIFTPDTPVEVSNGTTSSFSADIVLSTAGDIVDQSVIEFQIEGENSGFTSDPAGSLFSSSFTDITGNEVTLDVVSSDLAFAQQPSEVALFATMQPDVEVEFVDVNGNRDTDATGAVEITSSGDLNGVTVTESAVSGVATFSSLVHNTSGTDLTLTATSTDPFSVLSNFFDVISNDETSEVVFTGTQVGSATLIAANSTVNSTPVFNFQISDFGSGDGVPTEVSQMRFVPGPDNTADWSSTLQQAIVNDNTGAEIPGTYNITDSELIFTPDAFVTVGDGATANFSLDIILATTNIIDQSVLEFQVSADNTSGFIADFTGSQFNSNFTGGDVIGNEFTIDVIATDFAILQQPTDVEVDAFINPAVQFGYVDANGNIDTSITTDVSLTSSGGTLVDPLSPVPAVAGVATFPNIAYSAVATNLFLTATTTEASVSPSSLDTDLFDVGTPVIAVQDFDGTSPQWNYSTSIPTFDNGWGNGFFGVINSGDASPLASGSFVDNIFGENDLNDNNGDGTSGIATLNFETVNIFGFTDVNLSFDWEVNGYNASSDSLAYEVFFDGVSQGEVLLYEGGVTSPDSGTVSIPVDPGTEEVSFIYYIQNDGLTGYSGLDNVKLTGNSNARDSDITAPGTQIPSGTLIADLNYELAEAEEVFSFDIVDSGNFDALPTTVTRLKFVAGSLNSADWSDVIQGISITDGSVNSLDLIESDPNLTITPTELIVDIVVDPNDIFLVADGTSKSYTLSLYLNQSGITDEEAIQLAIAEGNEDQLASSDGSIFSNSISAFEGNDFLIDVVGDGLEFIVQPTNTVLNENMVPAVRVADTDANGNLDLDSVGETVSISSTGSLIGDPVTNTIDAAGFANFNTLQHDALGFNLTLTASVTGFTDVDSNEFNISFETDLLISEVAAPFDSGFTDSNLRFVELFNMSVDTLDFSDKSYYLHNAISGNSVQLTGILPPKSYYIVSFADATTFSGVYSGITPDLQSSSVITSDGVDAYYLSVLNTEASLVDIHGTIDNNGGKPTWDYSDGRYYRDIPNIRNSNPIYDEAGEWIKQDLITEADPTPGVGDNDFVYSNDTDTWTAVGVGDSPDNVDLGINNAKSIFVENGTATLTALSEISDVVVREGATLIIEDAITLNGDFANFGKVIFRSTERETAALGEFDAVNRSLVGTNFEIERFIPSNNRAFRYLSSSVISNESINANWQEGVNNTQSGDVNNIDPNPGFGTHITGSTDGSNGFDATSTGNASMYEWNATGQLWNPIANTDATNFTPGKAYALLIRGDRSTTLNSNTAVGPSTTLRTTGRLVVGSRGVNDVSSVVDEFNFIGNPYQAKVDMTSLLGSGNSSGVNSQFVYIYDPTLGDIGGYATVDLSNGTPIPSGSDADQFLDPNQAFFVETISSGATPAVVFRESYKTTATGNNATFSLPEDTSDLSINLFFDDSETKAVDGVKVKFRPGANNAKDTLDATKIWNYRESVAINRNPKYMAIETRGMPSEQDSIPLYFGGATKSAYRWEINPKHLTTAEAILWDKYLETAIELTTDETTIYSFTLDNSIPESTATDRFVIRFENVTLGDDNFDFESSVVVYPNPINNNRFSISQNIFESKAVNIQLYDLQGREVMNQSLNNTSTIEVKLNEDISSGVYILRLTDGMSSQSVKLIVE